MVFTCCTEINKVRIFRRNTILNVNSLALLSRVPSFECQVLYQTLGSIIVARAGFRRKCLLASIIISIKTRQLSNVLNQFILSAFQTLIINYNAFKVLAQQLKNLTDLFFVFMLVLKYFKLVFLVKMPCTWLQAQPCLKIELSFPVKFVLELTQEFYFAKLQHENLHKRKTNYYFPSFFKCLFGSSI